MDGSDLCLEIVKRARAGFVYSEAVARYTTVQSHEYPTLFDIYVHRLTKNLPLIFNRLLKAELTLL